MICFFQILNNLKRFYGKNMTTYQILFKLTHLLGLQKTSDILCQWDIKYWIIHRKFQIGYDLNKPYIYNTKYKHIIFDYLIEFLHV